MRPALVGVVNVTPDSFSDGGHYLDAAAARAHVDRLLDEGADVVEIGGESTRPAGGAYGEGYRPVDAATQIARILPVIEHAVGTRRALVAVDTTLAEVARVALEAGASIVNDVSCLADVELARVAAERNAWLVLMHSRPGATSRYDDLIEDVAREWRAARDRAVSAGVPASRIVMDPGVGFGKSGAQNFRVLTSIARFVALGHPVYVGASRKTFIAWAEEHHGARKSAPNERLSGSVVATLCAVRGGASAIRVHDVAAMKQALAVDAALREAARREEEEEGGA